MIKITNLTLLVLCFTFTATINAFGQQTMPLYEGDIPNSKKAPDQERALTKDYFMKVSRPTLTVFYPPAGTSNGTSIILYPGGGYTAIAFKECTDLAEKFNAVGITAFILKYRLPDTLTMIDKSIGPLQDAQRAIIVVKTGAKQFNIDTAKVGILGLSAGGHLAALTGTLFNRSFVDNPLNISLRPAFMILIYPLISLTNSNDPAVQKTLLGKSATESQIALYSADLQVTPNTPPTFLMHAEDDKVVSVKNSISFYLALQKNNVPAGLHIYPKGQHVFTLEPAHSTWLKYCVQWIEENGWAKQ